MIEFFPDALRHVGQAKQSLERASHTFPEQPDPSLTTEVIDEIGGVVGQLEVLLSKLAGPRSGETRTMQPAVEHARELRAEIEQLR